MFSKTLILVLLGCALALANPIPKNEQPILQPRHHVNIGSWLQKVHEEATQIFRQTVEPYEKTYYSLVEAEKSVHIYNINKTEQLRSLYHEITDEGREQLSNIEVTVLTNTIEHLQNAVEYLGMQVCSHSIEQRMQLINKNIQAEQEAVTKGNKNLQEIVTQKPNNTNDKIDQPQSSGGLFDELGNKLKDAISKGVKDIKVFASDGIKFVQGVIGSDAQEALGSGKNTSDKGVDNVKEHVSNGENRFELTKAVNEFANKDQNSLENKILKEQNQYNQYDPAAKGVGQHQDNVYDSKSAFDKIEKQLIEAVNVHRNKVLQNLIFWRNRVEKYLVSGERILQVHDQVMNEEMDHGVKNVQGTFEKLTNTAEGMGHEVLSGIPDEKKTVQVKLQNIAEGLGNNIQGNGGMKSPNVAEGMSNNQEIFKNFQNSYKGKQESFQTPKSVGTTVSMPETTEHTPKIEKDLVTGQPPTDDEKYKRFGEKVGAHIGGHVDFLKYVFRNFWKNAEKND